VLSEVVVVQVVVPQALPPQLVVAQADRQPRRQRRWQAFASETSKVSAVRATKVVTLKKKVRNIEKLLKRVCRRSGRSMDRPGRHCSSAGGHEGDMEDKDRSKHFACRPDTESRAYQFGGC
jgi:hypothetical protein